MYKIMFAYFHLLKFFKAWAEIVQSLKRHFIPRNFFFNLDIRLHLKKNYCRKNLAIERMIVEGCDILLDVNQEITK